MINQPQNSRSNSSILKKSLRLTALFICLTSAQSFCLDAKIINSSELNWQGKPGQVQVAFISGNEQTQGMYIYRVRFPQGHKISPHFHSDQRAVTVLKGSLYVGYGTEFDADKMIKLEAGGIWTEPQQQPHFVWAKEGEVELQVMGYGPSSRSQALADSTAATKK